MLHFLAASGNARRGFVPRRLLDSVTTVPLLLLLTTLLIVSLPAIALAAERPNVVVIMTDDQGIGDFGATGNSIIETPRIDAMAKRSASMATFYVSPVCSPTRACLMTGRYNYRTRCIDTWVGRSMMEPEEWTLAEALAKAGYATGIFGKWHLGDNYPMRPQDQGFAEVLVHRGGGLAQPSEPRENNRRYTNPILFHNGEQVQTKGYCTDVYFDSALQFIEQSHKAGKNFFTYIPPNAPHGPYHDVPEDLRKHYAGENLGKLFINEPPKKRRAGELDKLARIAAMITNVDQNVGRLLDKLDALDLTDNTMVVFLVDNGPNTMRYVGDRRGMKSFVHEGGIRAPLWIQWPARLKAGTVRDELAAHIDLMPTILDAAGVAPPQGHRFDGRSFLPLLTDPNASRPEKPIVLQSHRGDAPFRYHHFMIRDGDWKLLHASGFGRESFPGEPKFELYNLKQDPRESKNLVDTNPEVLSRLKQQYDRWFDDVSSTRPDNYAPPRIHVGTPFENPSVLTRQDWRGGTWGKNAIGHWVLHVAQAGDYEFRLLFDASQTAENAELKIAGLTQTGKIPARADEFTLSLENLPAGEAQLHVRLKNGNQQRGVYQVEVRRK